MPVGRATEHGHCEFITHKYSEGGFFNFSEYTTKYGGTVVEWINTDVRGNFGV